MAEQSGKNILASLRTRWRIQGVTFCLFIALTFTLLLLLFDRHSEWPGWIGPLFFVVSFGLTLTLTASWRLSLRDISRYLDSRMPALEESCGLLLQNPSMLPSLQKLQQERTASVLIHSFQQQSDIPRPFRRKILWSAALLLASVMLFGAIKWNSGKQVADARLEQPAPSRPNLPVIAQTLPGIRNVLLRITPPAYTGRPQRQQHQLDCQVEEGALVNWELETTAPIDSITFLFNDTVRIALTRKDTARRLWRLASTVRNPGFYQVQIGGKLSELYKIEMVKDEPPQILIRNPKPYTVIDFGEPKQVSLLVKLQDDYGIADATIVATVASGRGEAVKFKEETLHWDRSFTGYQSNYDLQRKLDLSAMGLKPGDELYFYCRAKDNHGQEARSDMYIISLPDTAQLMSLEGLTTGVDIKPEYFRSERQIILETEQLLKEKDTLSLSVFNNRSNDLGFDQKLLRLRYGKFLGEESEEGTPGSGTQKDEHPDFGNAAKILDAYTDKHDNAEDATYFEPAVKEQLKATLTEMWNAELRFRTYQPAQALPYAYKALRLLKDLQQKSRAFVAKTGVHTTPLDPAKRLSGKLDAIGNPLQTAPVSGEPAPDDFLRMALALLEQWDNEPVHTRPASDLLQRASRELGRKAAARPAEYLAGYQAMRRIGHDESQDPVRDILLAQQAISRLLPKRESSPSKAHTAGDAGLSQLYFQSINPSLKKP